MWSLVSEIANRGTTVLLTTRYLDDADQLADRTSILKEGAVIAEGTPTELKKQRGGERVEITAPAEVAPPQLLAALGKTATLADAETGIFTYPAPRGAADLIEVVRLLDTAGITPDDISLRRPTLDEVFLAVTDETPDTQEKP